MNVSDTSNKVAICGVGAICGVVAIGIVVADIHGVGDRCDDRVVIYVMMNVVLVICVVLMIYVVLVIHMWCCDRCGVGNMSVIDDIHTLLYVIQYITSSRFIMLNKMQTIKMCTFVQASALTK